MIYADYAQLTTALEKLGYEKPIAKTKYVSFNRFMVWLGDRNIGIWDTGRKTFVD